MKVFDDAFYIHGKELLETTKELTVIDEKDGIIVLTERQNEKDK